MKQHKIAWTICVCLVGWVVAMTLWIVPTNAEYEAVAKEVEGFFHTTCVEQWFPLNNNCSWTVFHPVRANHFESFEHECLLAAGAANWTSAKFSFSCWWNLKIVHVQWEVGEQFYTLQSETAFKVIVAVMIPMIIPMLLAILMNVFPVTKVQSDMEQYEMIKD